MRVTWTELFTQHRNADPYIFLASVIHAGAEEISSRLQELTNVVREKGEQLMAKSQELQDALDAITKAIQGATAEMKKLSDELVAIAANPTIDPAQVSATAASLQSLASGLNAAVGADDAAANPPALPTPTPAPAPAP